VMSTLLGRICYVVRPAVTPSRSSTHWSTNVSRPWRRWGSVWRTWNEWSRMTTNSWTGTCGSCSAWWGTWRASGARAVESSTRELSFPLSIFVRYNEDVVWF
jgi:hypothetical protein